MELVADASTFLAVALNERERDAVVRATAGAQLVAPAVLPYEVANALVATVKLKRLLPAEAHAALCSAQSIPVRLVPVDLAASLALAFELGVYAYDAYYLQCARAAGLPLLTLDAGMSAAARKLRIPLVEVHP